MKNLTGLVIVGASLIVLTMASNAMGVSALRPPSVRLVSPDNLPRLQPTSTPTSSLFGQVVNTPTSPGVPSRSRIYEAPRSLDEQSITGQTQPKVSISEQRIEVDAQVQRAYEQVKAVHQGEMRSQETNARIDITRNVLPQASTAVCRDMIMNPEMDVVEFGDGTGTIEFWEILHHIVQYSTQTYHSAQHSLVMRDDSDPYGSTETYDIDKFGQGFQAPNGLTYLKISFSSLFQDVDGNEVVWAVLFTLDSEGYLDQIVDVVEIPTSTSWQNWFWELDSSGLADASGEPLALIFEMWGNRATPNERIYLDDAQVRLCYESGPHMLYLPSAIKPVAEQVEQGCAPLEPDSVAQRGSTTVGATCDGSFSAWDTRDYYSADLNDTGEVRLRLFDLPSGTNWDAMIYEDKGDGTYPLACHIGTPGDQDKSKDCTLNTSKNYFVMVNAGTAPSGGSKTYHLSIEQR